MWAAGVPCESVSVTEEAAVTVGLHAELMTGPLMLTSAYSPVCLVLK